jgi:hypothetical protein
VARAFAHPCMGLLKSSNFWSAALFFFRFDQDRFSVRLQWPFFYPDHGFNSRRGGAVVKAGRRPPRQRREAALTMASTARRFLVGRGIGVDTADQIGGELACRAEASSAPQQPCMRATRRRVGDHDAVMRIVGEAPKGGPILQQRHDGHGWVRDTAASDRHRQHLARWADATERG